MKLNDIKIGCYYKIKYKNKYIPVKIINIYYDKKVCVEYLSGIRTIYHHTKIKELTVEDKVKLL